MVDMITSLRDRLSPDEKRLARRVSTAVLSALPNSALSLTLLGAKHGTDKLSHSYLPYYHEHFRSIRHRRLNVLEIGIGCDNDPVTGGKIQGTGGASLRMWRDYFSRSRIFGLDIDEKGFIDRGRIRTFQGDQNDPACLEAIADEIGRIDVIIDDGSHVNEHVITALSTLFPRLHPDGLYAIEDLHTAYLPHYGGDYEDLDNGRTSVSMLKSLVDCINHEYIPNRRASPFDGALVSMHFYPKLAVMQKGNNRGKRRPHDQRLIARYERSASA